jgi:hypothetical protein
MSIITMDPEQFRAHYNRQPFTVSHRLAEHPLTSLASLRALALRLPKDNLRYRVRAKIDDSFDVAAQDHPSCPSVGEVIDRIHEPGSAVQISRPEEDPEYRPLVSELLAGIRRYTEPVDPTMTYTATYFFIAGPECLTPYHMDREMNFLLHIAGPKALSLWDPSDDAIMSEAERERLFFEWWRPAYKPEFEAKATRFELRPGTGVHHPFIAPHAARTGATPSISMAVTFRTRRSDDLRLLYRMNYRLRKLGLQPKRVGTFPRLDDVKLAVVRALKTVQRRSRTPAPAM